jgi:alpha-N-acetylglucosaminidase
LEYDVRSLLTTWGGRASSEEGLHDYANREWSGLVGGLYRTRWKTYFDALATGKDPATIDWFALEDRWAHAHESHPTKPHGSAYVLARRVRDLLAATPHQAALTAAADRAAVAEGKPATVTVTFTNRNGFTAVRDVTLCVAVPKGMTAKPLDPVRTPSVTSGGTFTARFEISLAGGPARLVGQVVASAAYAGGGKAVAPLRLLAATGVEDPYRTVSYADAVFGQSGDEIAIEGAGADLWGSTNEFGAVYRAGACLDKTVAEVRVTAQDPTGGWARAGIVVRNDLTAQGSAGYVNLAVTPSNGCALSWDADGDGRFDSIELSGSFTAPVRLRLTRSGASYLAQASTDGVTWTTVGTATPSGVATAQDIGVFMTAANGWTGTRGMATFDGFKVT